jgi:hypothetical protein
MELNATFNNISAISWRSVLFVEETGVPGENHRSVVDGFSIISNFSIVEILLKRALNAYSLNLINIPNNFLNVFGTSSYIGIYTY